MCIAAPKTRLLCFVATPQCLNGGVADGIDCDCFEGFIGARCEINEMTGLLDPFALVAPDVLPGNDYLLIQTCPLHNF